MRVYAIKIKFKNGNKAIIAVHKHKVCTYYLRLEDDVSKTDDFKLRYIHDGFKTEEHRNVYLDYHYMACMKDLA